MDYMTALGLSPRKRGGAAAALSVHLRPASSTLELIGQCTRAVFCRSINMAGTGSEDVLDLELVIVEAKKHPDIWNVAAEEFHDRSKKRSSWIDVCRQFCDGLDEKEDSEKNQR
ncbi:hypothetical protein PR048_006384 [Dryococelus australis]|uniref:MADF domain-containing protein n=1 Tax=Dryococelus australis TaxID=614101 RepID=A0ABQ9ID26_9NEOP|nr:hypothetical protein PR048_006384 [Dryococelus australis]